MCGAGFSTETEAARRQWIDRIQTVAAAGDVKQPEMKQFKPKFPQIPALTDYRKPAPPEFWAQFPSNYKCPAKSAMSGKQLKRWVDALGCDDEAGLARVFNYIENGADIGCRGTTREPSRSSNAAGAFAAGAQVTDAVAEWTHKGYAFGPVDAEAVPRSAKVSGIMVRPKPNGSVQVILNLSVPKGQSVNDGIDKTEFPAKMSSTAAWLEVLDQAGRGCWITKTDWAAAYKQVCVRQEDTDLQWFSWGGKFFKELCLIFGGISSAGIYNDAAKLVADLVRQRAAFPIIKSSLPRLQKYSQICRTGTPPGTSQDTAGVASLAGQTIAVRQPWSGHTPRHWQGAQNRRLFTRLSVAVILATSFVTINKSHH